MTCRSCAEGTVRCSQDKSRVESTAGARHSSLPRQGGAWIVAQQRGNLRQDVPKGRPPWRRAGRLYPLKHTLPRPSSTFPFRPVFYASGVVFFVV